MKITWLSHQSSYYTQMYTPLSWDECWACLNHVHSLSCVSPFQSFFKFLGCLSRAVTRAHKNAGWEFKLYVLLIMTLNQHEGKKKDQNLGIGFISFNFTMIPSKHEPKTENSIILYCCTMFLQAFIHRKVCFPRTVNKPAVWTWEITYLLTGSSIDTHMAASQEALPACPTDSFINLDTQTEQNQWAKQLRLCVPVRFTATSDRMWKGQRAAESWVYGSAWVVLGVYKNRDGMILWFHLQMEP